MARSLDRFNQLPKPPTHSHSMTDPSPKAKTGLSNLCVANAAEVDVVVIEVEVAAIEAATVVDPVAVCPVDPVAVCPAETLITGAVDTVQGRGAAFPAGHLADTASRDVEVPATAGLSIANLDGGILRIGSFAGKQGVNVSGDTATSPASHSTIMMTTPITPGGATTPISATIIGLGIANIPRMTSPDDITTDINTEPQR